VEVCEVLLRIHAHEVDSMIREGTSKDGLWDAPVHRHKHRLIVLVSVVVEHEENLAELREHVIRVPSHQVRVVEDDVGRDERLWDAPAMVHRVEAEMAAEVAHEVQTFADDLRGDEESRRQECLDARRDDVVPDAWRHDDRTCESVESLNTLGRGRHAGITSLKSL